MIVNLPTHICVTRPQWVNMLETSEPCHFGPLWGKSPVHYPHKGTVMRKVCPCHGVISVYKTHGIPCVIWYYGVQYMKIYIEICLSLYLYKILCLVSFLIFHDSCLHVAWGIKELNKHTRSRLKPCFGRTFTYVIHNFLLSFYNISSCCWLVYLVVRLCLDIKLPAQKASNAGNVSIWWRHRHRITVMIRTRRNSYLKGMPSRSIHSHFPKKLPPYIPVCWLRV